MIRIKKSKENKNIKRVIIVLILIILIPLLGVFAKYIYRDNYDTYLRSKEFYFYSNVLKLNNKTYNIDNWDGKDYEIDININNILNNLVWTSYSIDYDVIYTCPNEVKCNLSTPSSDTLTYNENKGTSNNLKLVVTPKEGVEYKTGDKIEINIKATSKTKYKKTLSATFILSVSSYGISYSITDNIDRYYLTLQLNNTTIVSKNINLSFDSNDINIDNTNTVVLKSSDNDLSKDSNNRINGINLKIEPSEEITINFFKKDITKNYTYPFETTDSIITVNET